MRFLIPLAILAGVVALLAVGLTKDPREVPSPLIGKAGPAFELPTLADPEVRFTGARFAEHPVSLFNVWASWCVACRQEHPLLMRLAREDGMPIYGLNYKDRRAAARDWLARYGNPYLASAFDGAGQVGIDWGVYGVPETYVVDREGVIRHKHIGPLTERAWRDTIRPVVERLRSRAG
jgi:cytochrome c biogenesis protein CcmG/thiol:disulfide interchange protein DsbE